MTGIHIHRKFEIEVKREGKSPLAPVLDSQDAQRGQFQLPIVEGSAGEIELGRSRLA
jgi:hypothetical protein